jgi:hypothetical protein
MVEIGDKFRVRDLIGVGEVKTEGVNNWSKFLFIDTSFDVDVFSGSTRLLQFLFDFICQYFYFHLEFICSFMQSFHWGVFNELKACVYHWQIQDVQAF